MLNLWLLCSRPLSGSLRPSALDRTVMAFIHGFMEYLMGGMEKRKWWRKTRRHRVKSCKIGISLSVLLVLCLSWTLRDSLLDPLNFIMQIRPIKMQRMHCVCFSGRRTSPCRHQCLRLRLVGISKERRKKEPCLVTRAKNCRYSSFNKDLWE